MECGKCHVHKGTCFGENVERKTQGSPAARGANDVAGLRAELDRVQKERQAMAVELKSLRAARAPALAPADAPADAATEDVAMPEEG